MLKSIKNLCVVVLFLLSALSVDAQSKMEYNVYGGISTAGIFDDGYGLTTSVNPIWAKNDNFKLESRLGYTLENNYSSYYSESFGKVHWAMIQVGPRVVFRPADKKFRPAMNMLSGYHHLLTATGNSFQIEESGFSIPLNIEAEIGRIIFGITLDAVGNEIPNNAGLKLGFKF